MSIDSGSTRKPRRVGDEERHACVDQLATHHAHGRLSQEDFEERLGLALTAQTGGDLGRLLVDLPLPESTPARTSAREPAFAHGMLVSSGVLLLVLTWIMVVVMLGVAEDDAALAAAVASAVSVVATLLLMSGIRSRRAQRPDRRRAEGPSRG